MNSKDQRPKRGKKLSTLFSKAELKHISLIAILIILDQITKFFARTELKRSIALIPKVFHLTLVKNTGMGFGLLKESNTLLIFITVIIIGLLIYYFRNLSENKHSNISLCLITAGALSNLIDRITLHHIIDFIDFRIWPVFNLADAFISIGIIYLIYATFKKEN